MNDFIKHTMSEYTDERLLNMVKQAHNFDAGAVQVAKDLAVERNLATIQQLDYWASTSQQAAQTQAQTQSSRRYYDDDDSGISPWTVLLIIFIIIKLVFAFAR